MVTKEMICAAHDICLKKGDFVLSANLLERIYLAMRDKADERDSAGWDAYEDLRKASDEMVLNLRQRVQELEKERDKAHQYWQIAEGRCDALMKQRDELEAVLRECREALVHCEGVFDEVRGYPITYDLTIEAIAKIDEVLK